MRHKLFLALLMAAPAGAFAASGITFPATHIAASSKTIMLPGPGTSYTGPGAEILNTNCLLCHSPTFVDTQPPLSPQTWQAEVEKMRKVFGAPIDPAVIPELVKVLTERHGTPPNSGGAAAGESGSSG